MTAVSISQDRFEWTWNRVSGLALDLVDQEGYENLLVDSGIGRACIPVFFRSYTYC